MKIRKAVRYICDHCSKGFWHKEDCLDHEKKCYRNPVIKSCWNCGHFSDEDGPWFCLKYEKDLCINPTEHHELRFKNKECEDFKNK